MSPINGFRATRIPEPEKKPGKRIEIRDFFINMKPVAWKGKEILVEYDLFILTIQGWIKREKISKEKALDDFFSMDV